MYSSLIAAAIAGCGAQQAFTVHTDGVQTPLVFPQLECVGSGHLGLGNRFDYRQTLQNAARDIGFKYVRGHGVLDDDLSTYLNNKANMYNVFMIYDFFIANNMRPIVELSFMPSALANDTSHTIMHYNGITSGPNSLEVWQSFISEFVQLLVARYGVQLVREFRFEVWNEPNSCGFWCAGGGVGTDLKQGYFSLYSATAAAIKSVDPLLSVGGPATAELLWVQDFVHYTQANKVPVDFVSTHLYPSDPGLPSSRTVFEDSVAGAAEIAASAGLPLLLTEFDAGWSLRVSDEPYTAAFLVHTALAFQNTSRVGIANTKLASYWTFSDVFEEAGFWSAPYDSGEEAYQKFGLQTIYGVPKPGYRAMEMVAGMRGLSGVPVSAAGSPTWYGPSPSQSVGATSGTVDVLTAIDTRTVLGHTVVSALVNNWNLISSNATLPVGVETVTLTFTGIPSSLTSTATATIATIDSTHAYGKGSWRAQGSPIYPTPAQTATELAASQVVAVPISLSPNPPAGSVTLSFSMEAYAVAMVQLTY